MQGIKRSRQFCTSRGTVSYEVKHFSSFLAVLDRPDCFIVIDFSSTRLLKTHVDK
jgi:hypothetical protein